MVNEPTPAELADAYPETWEGPVLRVVRGLVRPVSTLTLIGATIWFTERGAIDADVISTATVAAFAFWFGGRTNGGS